MLQLFQIKKGSIFSIISFVYSGYIAFPYILHLSTLVTLFCCFTRNICLTKECTSCLSLVHIENTGFGYLLGWLHCLHLSTVLRRDKMQPSGILLSFYAVSTLTSVSINLVQKLGFLGGEKLGWSVTFPP